MAATLPPRARANNASHAPSTRSAEDQELLSQLDACVDRMRTHISDEPYVLTIPQDEPKYHHYSRSSADAWLKDTPFDHGENYQMQYQTFFYREPNSDTFERVRASHFDRSMGQLPSTSTPRSNTVTPSLGPKKKISLATYNKNKKDQSALSTPSNSQSHSQPQSQPHGISAPVLTLSKPQPKTDKDPSHTKAEKVQPQGKTEKPPANHHVPGSATAPTSNVLKRRSIHESSRPDTQNPLKKLRLSPQPQAKPQPSSQLQQPRPRNDARMPLNFPSGRLSPLAALSPNGRLSPLTTAYLPGRISPTLPPEFVAALDERHHKRSQSHGSTGSADSTAQPKVDPTRPGSKHDSILSHANEPTSDDAVIEQSQKRPLLEPSQSTKSELPSKTNPSSVEKDAAPESSKKDAAFASASSKIDIISEPSLNDSSPKGTENTTQSDGKPQSLVVVLRIPKSKRNDARRLLIFPPQPWKDPKPDASATLSPEAARSNGAITKKIVKPSAEKRVPKMDEEPVKGVARKISVSSKSNQDKAHIHTPKPAPAPASSSTSSAKRPRPEDDSLHSTEPVAKKKKSVPTLKVDNDPTTPVQPDFRSPALPHSAVKSQQATPTPRKDILASIAMKRTASTDSTANNTTPTISNRTPASQAAAGAERPRHNSSNPRPSPSTGSNKTPLSKAWTAEYSRLSTLARELKHATPSSAEASALTWLESFLAFVLAFYCLDTSYTCNAELPPSPENWKSCGGFYGAVVHSCQKFPHLHGLALYLGAVYNGVIMRRISSVSSKHYDPSALHGATFAALRAADEAAQKLPLPAIMANYRNTWTRGISASEKDERSPTPRHYDGRFSLNVGVNTDPLEAVRFAHSVMTEWCDGRDIDHKMRLKLES